MWTGQLPWWYCGLVYYCGDIVDWFVTLVILWTRLLPWWYCGLACYPGDIVNWSDTLIIVLGRLLPYSNIVGWSVTLVIGWSGLLPYGDFVGWSVTLEIVWSGLLPYSVIVGHCVALLYCGLVWVQYWSRPFVDFAIAQNPRIQFLEMFTFGCKTTIPLRPIYLAPSNTVKIIL